MSRQQIDIRPGRAQFKAAMIFTLDHLAPGDGIEVHEEGTPPWFRIVVQDGRAILAEMRRLGVPTTERPA